VGGLLIDRMIGLALVPSMPQVSSQPQVTAYAPGDVLGTEPPP
jgi:hypothetical protein